ncbi:Uncharacterised protein [Kingella kingae]|uniref:Uncharacterized protein n=1 Tax=Kingella kingae TaxID=504 RepID=A0AAX2J0F8_KINKI|nr:Uncharacterised protein [Kingella kingae]
MPAVQIAHKGVGNAVLLRFHFTIQKAACTLSKQKVQAAFLLIVDSLHRQHAQPR